MNERRRLEGELSSAIGELDLARGAQREAQDRADRLQNEVNRLYDELRQEQENYKHAENLRKQLEVELRELTVKLEEAEAWAQREGKKAVARLTQRVRELEAELEIEQRNHRSADAAWRKADRQLKEALSAAEEDRRVVVELQGLVDTLQVRNRQFKKQLEEAEEATNISLGKYRKLQAELEDAEHRADVAEKNASIMRSRRHSMSVGRDHVRETVSHVRVVRI